MIQITAVLFFLLSAVAIGYYGNKQYRKQKQENEKKTLLQKRKSNTTLDYWIEKISQKSYSKLSRMPIVGRLVLNVRTRLETLAVYDEYKLRNEVMKILFKVVTTSLVFEAVVAVFRPSWQVFFFMVLGVVFVSGVMIDFFVYRIEAKLLKELKIFNSRLRYFYQQTKMVDHAVYEAIKYVGPEMAIQANKIYGILMSEEPDKELSKYHEVAPSRFLKVVAALTLMVQDQGDVVNSRGSAFLRGLSSINKELNMDIMYRSVIGYQMRGLSVLALVPVFLALPMRNWAEQYFPIMQTFYESRIGFLAEISVYGLAVMAYLVIRKMREVSEAKFHIGTKKVKWEQKLIDNVPLMEKIVNSFTPDEESKEYFNTKQLLKDANSPQKVEWVTVQKIVLSFSVFVVLVAGLLFSYHKEQRTIFTSVVPESVFAGNVTEDEFEMYKERKEFDSKILEDIKQYGIKDEKQLKDHIARQMGMEVNSLQVKQTYDRVAEKWGVLSNSFVKWYEVLLAIMISVIVWFIPMLLIRFQKYLRNKDMENEVHQHLVLISILREFDRMSTYKILVWMEMFGVIFREPLREAIASYDAGSEEALKRLNDQVSFEAFNQLIERLKLSLVRISIKEAFDDIDLEREFYLEHRQEGNRRSIENKSTLANMVSTIPMFALTMAYLVIPLIYLSLTQTTQIMSQI